jgi:predicted nucleotidyltransferase
VADLAGSAVEAAAVAEPAETGEARARAERESPMSETDRKLTELVGRLKDAAQANLHAAILYGSAARGDHQEGHSDLNVLCVMASLEVGEMKRVAPVVKWWTAKEKEPAPLFFTEKELHHSADVFAIELLDMQRDRRVLFGKDAIAEIHVPMNLHRVQVEHELRTMMLKLRQQFLLSAGNEAELRGTFSKSISSARTLARHALIALGEQPPDAPAEMFARVAQLTGADANAFHAGLELRTDGGRIEIAAAYGRYLNALEKVTEALEHHVPKKEWQRKGH